MFTCFFHFSQSHPTQTRNTHWHIRKMLCECDDSRMMTNELTRRANAQTTRIQVQNWKKHVSYIAWIHSSHAKHTVPDCFNQTTMKLQWKISKKKPTTTRKQFVVYASDTPVTLNQGLGHKTWYKLADPKQGYNTTNFEKPRLNLKSVSERANHKKLSSNQDIHQLSPLNMSTIVAYSWAVQCA